MTIILAGKRTHGYEAVDGGSIWAKGRNHWGGQTGIGSRAITTFFPRGVARLMHRIGAVKNLNTLMPIRFPL